MFKKTIFSKLLFTYLLLIILVMSAIAIFLSLGFSDYVLKEKQDDLRSGAVQTEELLERYNQDQITSTELNNSLNILSSMTGSRIYAIRVNKETLDNKNLVMDQKLLDSYLIEDIKKILDGQEVSRKKQYSDRFATEVVFLGVPLKNQFGIEGAILLFAPLDDIYAYLAKINLIIWLSAFAAVILSGLAIYFISLRISRPLKEMEEGARKITTGEQVEDLVLHSGDELDKLAEAFNNMKNKINAVEKMRRDFITGVSHDLRTPLTSINGFVQGMLEGLVKPEDNPKYLRIIREETQRLTRLTGDMLELAKIQSGEITLRRQYFSVREFLENMLENTGMNCNDKKIAITIDCPDGLEMYADVERFKQMVINVLQNALKYTENNGQIWISANDTSEKITLSVKDNGRGIAAEDLPFIFEKFYRGDKSRQELSGGTGLGLNIAKILAEMHGGSIRACSKSGQGTEITINFPK